MKKKMIAALLAGMMILAAGCGNKAGKVIIGEYKGMALTSVTQADVDAELQSMLQYYAELVTVEREAQDGDTVNINYRGLLDGVAFEGGTDDSEAGTDLELGSNSFIDGFEDGLIGAVAGEKRDLNLTFPETYSNAELAGKAVVFEVTVNEVKELFVPELTEEFLKKVAPEYASVDEFLTALRDAMNEDSYYDQIGTKLMEICEVEKYDEEAVAERKARLIADYTNLAETYNTYYGWGMETEQAVIYFYGVESMAALEEELGTYAYEEEKRAMIINEIAERENFEVSDEEYAEALEEMAAYYNYEDSATFEAENGKENILLTCLSEKILDLIIENAVISDAE